MDIDSAIRQLDGVRKMLEQIRSDRPGVRRKTLRDDCIDSIVAALEDRPQTLGELTHELGMTFSPHTLYQALNDLRNTGEVVRLSGDGKRNSPVVWRLA